MSKHTPGPWAVSKNDTFVFGQKQGNGLEPVGFIYGPACAENSDYGKRCIANVHLCAAAPAMLEALEKLVKWWDSEESGPQYTHPDKREGPNGDAEAREWFHGNVALAGETHALARAAIKAAKGEA